MTLSAIRRCDLRAGFLAALLPALAPGMAQAMPRVSAVVDLAADDGGVEAIEALAGQLPRFPTVIDLDLTVRPDPEGLLRVELVTLEGAPPTPLECDGGFGRIDGDHVGLRLPFGAIHPNLLLQVDLAGLSARDGLVLGCADDGSEVAVFHMMGRFLVSGVDIPAAREVLMVAQPVAARPVVARPAE